MSDFNTIPEITEDLKQGKMVIVIDDAERENEGDLIMPAAFVTAEAINFMAKHGRGLICMPMEGKRLDELNLHPMAQEKKDPFKTAWAISVDAKQGVTTGISASDRAQTVKTLISPETRPDDLVKPGHIFPLRAQEGGVLSRAGHTETCVDLMKLAGLYPAGVICEIMNEDGTMARTPELFEFARRHSLKICTVCDLIEYRRKRTKLIHRIEQTSLPTDYGTFKLMVYESEVDKLHHLALVLGEISTQDPVLVRVHSQCLTGDVFGSQRCDCGKQLEQALKLIQKEKSGVVLYMRQEGRGIGLVNKIRAYALQEQKQLDTVEANHALGFDADLRDYGIGAQILVELGITKIKLLTNNPKKIVGLEGYGLEITQCLPLEVKPNSLNIDYLRAKKRKLGHILRNV
ncbi:MAG: bifunctional 3,4-dihydroxy-2-butanone-4-phosphate synthase/GTP cyclohydrolase II [Candidatus Omnitrophica bacterium]|nr:bifunctional 3,4-dihydroxy-2-butanone-4-phosphate synthase/GTP cyclohydrolase II [Candidatus Omnitrophota bacterium]